MPVSPAARQFLRMALGDMALDRISLDANSWDELRSLLQTFLEFKLGRRIRSARFLAGISGFSLDTSSPS
jgi:hypothetical protein